MKLSEYIKVCNYDHLVLSVYYKDEEFENQGSLNKHYALEHYGNYEVVEISHTSRMAKVRTKVDDFADCIVIKPRLWIKKVK